MPCLDQDYKSLNVIYLVIGPAWQGKRQTSKVQSSCTNLLGLGVLQVISQRLVTACLHTDYTH